MTAPSEQLLVEVVGGEIMVILPATSYGVTYYKPANSRQLIARDLRFKVDRCACITQSEFLARALQAANEKARELGWIV